MKDSPKRRRVPLEPSIVSWNVGMDEVFVRMLGDECARLGWVDEDWFDSQTPEAVDFRVFIRRSATLGTLFQHANALLEEAKDAWEVHSHFLSMCHADIRARLQELLSLIEPHLRAAGLAIPEFPRTFHPKSVEDEAARWQARLRQVSENQRWIEAFLRERSKDAREADRRINDLVGLYPLDREKVVLALADPAFPCSVTRGRHWDLQLTSDDAGKPYAEIRWYSPILLTGDANLREYWQQLTRDGHIAQHFGETRKRRRGMSVRVAVRVWTIMALVAAGMPQREAIGKWNTHFSRYGYGDEQGVDGAEKRFVKDRNRLMEELKDWIL